MSDQSSSAGVPFRRPGTRDETDRARLNADRKQRASTPQRRGSVGQRGWLWREASTVMTGTVVNTDRFISRSSATAHQSFSGGG
ncbi:hypothetical protein P0D72_12780 [Paraburkholderia sediminicola]|uniref:hypothetical protein n=1 Tax=Paraburkholderia sediminicola TaxID=458836 RepID=UPI0038BCB2AB